MCREIPEEIKKIIGSKDIEEVVIKVRYKNYRGETSDRKIIPLSIFMGYTEHHKTEQYLLRVWDLSKQDYRTYAMKDIESWLEFPE